MRLSWAILQTFIRSYCLQTWWNYERLQHWGFAFSIAPLLKQLDLEPAKYQTLLRRHLAYFNTHPYFAPIVIGVVFHRYRNKKDNLLAEDPTVTVLKESMGAAFGALGDHVIWGTWRPFVSLLAMGIGVLATYAISDWTGCGLWWALGFLVIFNSVHIGLRLGGLIKAIHLGPKVVSWVESLHLQRWAVQLRKIAVLLVGLLTIIGLWYGSKNQSSQWVVILVAVFLGSVVLRRWRFPNVILVYLVSAVSILLTLFGWKAT